MKMIKSSILLWLLLITGSCFGQGFTDLYFSATDGNAGYYGPGAGGAVGYFFTGSHWNAEIRGLAEYNNKLGYPALRLGSDAIATFGSKRVSVGPYFATRALILSQWTKSSVHPGGALMYRADSYRLVVAFLDKGSDSENGTREFTGELLLPFSKWWSFRAYGGVFNFYPSFQPSGSRINAGFMEVGVRLGRHKGQRN